MADVLFIKTSSLGDVIHHMPAVTEARAHRPDARFAWVVEEAFAPLVRLHPAIDRGHSGGRAAMAGGAVQRGGVAQHRRALAGGAGAFVRRGRSTPRGCFSNRR